MSICYHYVGFCQKKKKVLHNNLVIRGELAAGSGPSDPGRGISRGVAVELQTLALLDVGDRRMDGDHGGAVLRCSSTSRLGTFSEAAPVIFSNRVTFKIYCKFQ